MGGSNETKIMGLRMHVNCDVHIHDDVKGIKFNAEPKSFKKEVDDALIQLGFSDGIVKIEGKTKTSFYICKDGNAISAFIADEKKSIKNDLQSFTRTC